MKKEFKPVRACILDVENIDPETRKTLKLIEANGVNLDWYGGEEVYDKNNIKNQGRGTYLISECDVSPE